VSAIGRDFVMLHNDDGDWRLKLGENLRSMQRTSGDGIE
jgi:hypothetical protein